MSQWYTDSYMSQLTTLGLQENLLSGDLPNSWVGLTQASHAATVVTQLCLCMSMFCNVNECQLGLSGADYK